MEEKQSQEKTDTYGEHSLKRDKVRGKMFWIKKLIVEKKEIAYILLRERKERTERVIERSFH